MSILKITLKKGLSRQTKRQIATVEALGLRKIGQTVEHNDNPAIRGMVRRVDHLVECVAADNEGSQA